MCSVHYYVHNYKLTDILYTYVNAINGLTFIIVNMLKRKKWNVCSIAILYSALCLYD